LDKVEEVMLAGGPVGFQRGARATEGQVQGRVRPSYLI